MSDLEESTLLDSELPGEVTGASAMSVENEENSLLENTEAKCDQSKCVEEDVDEDVLQAEMVPHTPTLLSLSIVHFAPSAAAAADVELVELGDDDEEDGDGQTGEREATLVTPSVAQGERRLSLPPRPLFTAPATPFATDRRHSVAPLDCLALLTPRIVDWPPPPPPAFIPQPLQSFKCADCAERFETLEGLETHVATDHLKWISWECAYCNVSKATRCLVLTHVASMHPSLPLAAVHLPDALQQTRANDAFMRSLQLDFQRHKITDITSFRHSDLYKTASPSLIRAFIDKHGPMSVKQPVDNRPISVEEDDADDDVQPVETPQKKADSSKAARKTDAAATTTPTAGGETDAKKLHCFDCASELKSRGSLMQHIKRHAIKLEADATPTAKPKNRGAPKKAGRRAPITKKMHDCELCGKGFTRKWDMKKHRKLCMGEVHCL